MKIRGFTLIEMIVSLAIFSIVAVIAIGALVRVTSSNRQAQAIQSGVNNVSFILDAISREMRVGITYHCETGSNLSNWSYSGTLSSQTCPVNTNLSSNPDTVIAFISSNPSATPDCYLVYAYLFHLNSANSTTTISKAQETTCGQFSGSAAQFNPILSSTVNIVNYYVGVFGNSTDPYYWAFLRLQGYVGKKLLDQSIFDVQTAISERSQN